MLLLSAVAVTGTAAAQIGGRFVDVIEVSERDDQADVTVQFNCSVRYITHLPATEGPELHIELQPLADCGAGAASLLASELPPVSGGNGIVSAARIESNVPGQISLVLTWARSERFVLAQGVDPRGLRIRLFDRAPRRTGKIVLNEPETISSYAINLDSQLKPFDAAAVQLAQERLKAPVFVSETTVDGQRWYRLRAGPIERRKEADQLLERALPDYPRAWLAIGDDTATNGPSTSIAEPELPGVQRIGTDAALDAPTLAKLVASAERALAARDYPQAITRLTQLQRQPEFPARAHVQELLGLARERSGQLAHAKAEYEEYLRRYPQGEAAERVALRLRILRTAADKPRAGTGGGGAATGWSFTGGIAQLFRYDGLTVDNTVPAGSATTVNGSPVPTTATTRTDELFNDVDFLARRRGESIDVLARFSGGYALDFGSGQSATTGTTTATGGSLSSDNKRISIASVELLDRPLGVLVRLGRQIRNDDGILGTFDGLFASYQFRPAWSVNVSAGYPVLLTSAGFQTDHRFEGLALDYAPPGSHWDVSLFSQVQQFDGARDRDGVGLNLRYLAPNASLIALTDYDVVYHSLNTAALIGSLRLPYRWTLSVDAERRNAPVLQTSNALIGEPVTTLAGLEQLASAAAGPGQTPLSLIQQWARDRTPVTEEFSVTATHPLGERFQFSVTAAADETAATPASGGVDAQPGTGLNHLLQAQIYGNSIWHTGDFDVVSLEYANTEVGKLESLSITSRFPAVLAWRIGPRLTVDRQQIVSDGSTQLTVVPSVLIDYQSGRKLLQLDLGGEIGRRDATLQAQNTTRYYVSLAYRISF